MNGIETVLELLSEFGVRYIFGNPGTSELPLNDALIDDDRFDYILGLQEVPVMAIADGYSMASEQLGVVNLHISCGLGNAMGILYNAFREGTPLLVTAGQQDRRLRFEEPILHGDMVAVAKTWTKWAYEVELMQDLPNAVRRAVQTAMTPPTGPVFLSLPMDLQTEIAGSLDLTPIRLPDPHIRPPVAAIEQAANLLSQAENPVILAGSRVQERGAVQALVQFAETVGAPVIAEPGTTHGRLPFPPEHPLYALGLPLWSPEIRERLQSYDVLFVTGMDLLRLYVHHEPACAIPEHLRIIHIDENPWQLGKNYPTEVGIIGNTKTSLEELTTTLQRTMDSDQTNRAANRRQQHESTHLKQRQIFREKVKQEIDSHQAATPMSSLAIMGAVANALPDDAAVVEAAVTTTNTTLERLGAIKNTSGYFAHRGWTLGWGLGVTIGAKLAWPDRPVLGVLGEGATMYGVQGLWTAAKYKIPAVFLVCNNAQYQILKIGARGLGLPNALDFRFKGLDISEPEIDFVALSEALGVDAVRISNTDELTDVIRYGFDRETPILVDVPIERETPDRLNYG